MKLARKEGVGFVGPDPFTGTSPACPCARVGESPCALRSRAMGRGAHARRCTTGAPFSFLPPDPLASFLSLGHPDRWMCAPSCVPPCRVLRARCVVCARACRTIENWERLRTRTSALPRNGSTRGRGGGAVCMPNVVKVAWLIGSHSFPFFFSFISLDSISHSPCFTPTFLPGKDAKQPSRLCSTFSAPCPSYLSAPPHRPTRSSLSPHVCTADLGQPACECFTCETHDDRF